MRLGLVFSGQGGQHPGMLRWAAHEPTLAAVAGHLGADWRERLQDPDWAARNLQAQLLLTGLGLAAWTELAALLPPPVVVAGYSVGEVAAFAAAGAFNAASALALAEQRALCMDRAAASQVPTGLLAVVGLPPDATETLCERHGLAVAIRNGPDSVVIGGPRSVLPDAALDAERQGARSTALKVALASHTPWMHEAAAGFAQRLSMWPLQAPATTLLSNVGGRVRNAAQAREALARQIERTVRWDLCMEDLAAQRIDCLLEVGPGRALAQMWQQRHPEVPARSADEFHSAAALVRWIERQAAR